MITATRNTVQRALITEAAKALDHPTAEEIFGYIHRSCPSVSRGTVYRNLNLMADAGELLRVPVADGGDIYDKTAAMHYHVRCNLCGKVADVTAEGFDPLGAISDSAGYKIDGCEVMFTGLCPACAEKSRDE